MVNLVNHAVNKGIAIDSIFSVLQKVVRKKISHNYSLYKGENTCQKHMQELRRELNYSTQLWTTISTNGNNITSDEISKGFELFSYICYIETDETSETDQH